MTQGRRAVASDSRAAFESGLAPAGRTRRTPGMKHGLGFLFALALGFTPACAGEQHDAQHGGEAGKHHDGAAGEHHDHHDIASGPVGEFHAVLSPLWHADKSPERTAKTCDQAATLRGHATAVEAGPPPAGASADAFKASAKTMTEAVDALIAACGADGRPEVEAKFAVVHDAFHKVAEAGGAAHHEEHK